MIHIRQNIFSPPFREVTIYLNQRVLGGVSTRYKLGLHRKRPVESACTGTGRFVLAAP